MNDIWHLGATPNETGQAHRNIKFKDFVLFKQNTFHQYFFVIDI